MAKTNKNTKKTQEVNTTTTKKSKKKVSTEAVTNILANAISASATNEKKTNKSNADRNYILSQLFSKLSTDKKELIRPIVPVSEWVRDSYYVGIQGLSLFPFWIKVIEDIFEGGKLNYNIVVLGGGLGCTPSYIRKRTSLGYLNLTEIKEQLSKGNSVFVKTENGVESIKDVHFIGKQKIKIIHFNDGSSYECTHNHLFRTLTKGGEIQWVRADHLSLQDHILRSAHSGMFPDTNQCVEGKYAYTIGYYIGDGDSYLGKRFRIVYGDHKYSTESYSYVYTQLLDLSETHYVSVYESYNKCKGVLTGQTSRRFTIYTSSNKELFLSCGLNAKEKHIPDYANLFTKEETCLLLAGLFDSDGCVEYDNRTNHINVSFSSRNKILVYQIQTILHNLGIHSVVKIQDRSHSNKGVDYRLRIQDFYSIQKFYTLIPLKVEYKKELLGTYIQCIVSQKEYNKTSKSLKIKNLFNTLYTFCKDHSIVKQVNIPKCRPLDGISLGKLHYINDDLDIPLSESPTLDYLYNNQCYSAEIEAIEDSEEECGDIEIEGSHTYISDGIINHNTGKSTAGVYIMVRFLYELSCYENIHKHLGLNMDTAALVFLLFCITKKQVKNTTFRKLRETIDAIPYFKENFPRYERANDELRFPKNVLTLYGSGTGDAIGLDVCFSMVDEANFFSDASGNSTDMSIVSDLHRSLVARQASRFMVNGKNQSLSVVVSSSTYASGFTEELKQRSLTDPTIRYYRARVWDVKPKGTYTNERFYVFCGNDKVDPFIIEDVMDLASHLNVPVNSGMSIKDAVNLLPNDLRVLVDDVPIEFRDQYKVNLLKSIQDVSGFSIQSSGGLFNNRTVFDACVDDSIPNLFTKYSFVLETQNDSPTNSVMYYLSGRPFLHPECPRYVHIDLSLSTDTTGIACCYKFGEKEVDGVKHPVYYFDFCIRIVPPPPPKKISISRVEEFIIYLRDKLHITFGMISFDQYQSSSSQQRLQELGFPVRYQSVDRTDKAYLFFIDQMFLGTVKFNKAFADSIEYELFNLQHDRQRHKVDHILDTAHGYTKDVCDSCVGSLYNCFEIATPQVNFEDTYALSYLNSSQNNAPFTEESSWLFETGSVNDQVKEILDQEMQAMLREKY